MSTTAQNAEEEVIRVLVIGRDQLIRSGLRYEVDFIPTGRSRIPEAPLGYAPTLFTRLEYLWSYFRGRYRLALFPAPEPQSRWARLLAVKPLARLLQRFRPKGTTVALLDMNESTAAPEAAIAALRPDQCWKLNLTADAGKKNGPAGMTYHLLPCWVYPPGGGWGHTPWRAKDIDVFLPPGPDCPARRSAAQWLERLRKEKRLSVRIAPVELSGTELHEWLSRSRMVLSPVGEGFHSYRHYQAMMHGAAPVINEAPASLETTLVQGENALFYEESEEAFRTLLLWMKDQPESLEIVARQARQHAKQEHTPAAVSRAILAAARLPEEQ